MGTDIPTKPLNTPQRSSQGADLCELDSGYYVIDIPVPFFRCDRFPLSLSRIWRSRSKSMTIWSPSKTLFSGHILYHALHSSI